jgi:ribosomal protein S7
MNKKSNTKTIYYYLLKGFIKKGKIFKAKKLLNNIFLNLYKELNMSFEEILLKIFLTLNVVIEIRKIRKRKRIYLVPVSTTLKRRYFLIVKWLIESSIKKNTKQNNLLRFSENFKNEILNVVKQNTNSKNTESFSKKLKYNILENVKKNRSNAHFRW